MRITGMKLGIGLCFLSVLGANGLALAGSVMQSPENWTPLLITMGMTCAGILIASMVSFNYYNEVIYESKPKLPKLPRAEAKGVE